MSEHMHKWMVIENIATMVFTVVACKFIGIWGLVLMFNISYQRDNEKE